MCRSSIRCDEPSVIRTHLIISYIDGDKGILRYRGYDIEDLAENSSFLEVYDLTWVPCLIFLQELFAHIRRIAFEKSDGNMDNENHETVCRFLSLYSTKLPVLSFTRI